MQKDKNGEYPVPELYDIEGSAHWRNKADNGLCVHRNFEEETVTVHVQKIKYRYSGKPGECQFIYNGNCGQFSEI
jgi:twinkle protein